MDQAQVLQADGRGDDIDIGKSDLVTGELVGPLGAVPDHGIHVFQRPEIQPLQQREEMHQRDGQDLRLVDRRDPVVQLIERTNLQVTAEGVPVQGDLVQAAGGDQRLHPAAVIGDFGPEPAEFVIDQFQDAGQTAELAQVDPRHFHPGFVACVMVHVGPGMLQDRPHLDFEPQVVQFGMAPPVVQPFRHPADIVQGQVAETVGLVGLPLVDGILPVDAEMVLHHRSHPVHIVCIEGDDPEPDQIRDIIDIPVFIPFQFQFPHQGGLRLHAVFQRSRNQAGLFEIPMELVREGIRHFPQERLQGTILLQDRFGVGCQLDFWRGHGHKEVCYIMQIYDYLPNFEMNIPKISVYSSQTNRTDNMKRKLLFLLALIVAACPLKADEGMWLPALISQRIADMQAKGFKLSAEDIYSVNQASLKDAVVLFGSGCTGELVSDQGLLFTNHHCGYSQIQQHSSVEHDYLKDGFWAMSRSEELPNKGLTVSFLERMEDVTAAVLKGYKSKMTEEERAALVRKNSDALVKAATAEGKGLRASVEALYYGNQYFLFVYRVYRDVRLVGAPPSSIGKFGGDTDNWMWPRHTGDFSIFRVYADKDNNPADYSPENVPYRPKKFFKISRAGVKDGDFTFVYGCPGSTKEYVTSDDVRYVGEVSDPQKIALRTLRLDIIKKYMAQSQAVRIQYSSKAASVSNAWKKWQGEAKGIAKMNTVAEKKAYEARFKQWAKGTRYDGLLEKLEALYAEREPYYRAYEYYTEAARPTELLQLASNVRARLDDKAAKDEYVESFFKDYYQPIDEEVFAVLMKAFGEQLSPDFQPAYYKEQMQAYGSAEAWRDDLFAKTLFTDKEIVLTLTAADREKVAEDPAVKLYDAFYQWYYNELRPVINRTGTEINLAYRDYMKGQMEFEPDKAFYPDANLTLRVAYGQVAGYEPADATWYRPVSTLKGIIQKDNPEIFDYNIPQTLRDIYAEGGHDDQPVCFLATNHTSGGNSGSPVINADGNLIGINFDRVWEGTMSDIVYDPEICRNISLDIRYLLFNIEYIGHAGYLFDEMIFAD